MGAVSVEEMRRIEEGAEKRGKSRLLLMEEAGKASAEFVRSIARKGSAVLVACGPGNNGGDGFVCARHLSPEFRVSVLAPVAPKTQEARTNLRRLGKRVKVLKRWPRREPDFIIDAMLGTGSMGGLREPIKSLVGRINSSGARVVSLDVPTGLNANTGKVLNVAVKPHYTVTFHAPKKGLGRGCGKVIVADIGL